MYIEEKIKSKIDELRFYISISKSKEYKNVKAQEAYCFFIINNQLNLLKSIIKNKESIWKDNKADLSNSSFNNIHRLKIAIEELEKVIKQNKDADL